MTQRQPPEPTNNHGSETESPSFVKRGQLWIPETVQKRSPIRKFWNWTGFKEKKLWDVLQLLIVPTALAIGAFYLQETAKQRDLQISEANRAKDQQIADDRAKQETLNRYFDQISTLLLERKLRTAKEGEEVRSIARVRTLTALRSMDQDRKGQLVKFLQEAKLIQGRAIIDLQGADLRATDLHEAYLSAVSLSGANLSGANLSGAILLNAYLNDANAGKADSTDLSQANSSKKDLQATTDTLTVNVPITTDLSGANLSGAGLAFADMSGANLSRANLSEAALDMTNLSKANLSGATLNSDQIKTAILCNTTMPNGTKSDRDCNKLK